MSLEAKSNYEAAIAEFSQAGYRTMCVAFSERPGDATSMPRTPPEDPLCIIAIVGIEEPLRPEVPSSILACRSAGVRVRMVTGDSVATATNIAQRCGILQSDSNVIDGMTFRKMSDETVMNDLLPRLAVLARATPLDKQRLVELIQRASSDAVVAVTGDGTNDAPALKAAAVGFSMNSGSDIAKQASDIVLLDDNFTGVVKALVWGRNVRDNIRKFLQFQLTVNTVACIVAFLGAVINTQNLSPLKPVQLLWLNLIMDTFAALALATELPNEHALLKRMPDPRHASIITRDMVHNIIVQASYQLTAELLLLGFAHRYLDIAYFGPEHLTVTFNAFVFMQVFNFFNARLLHADGSLFANLNKSTGMLYIVFLIVVLQVAIIEKGGKFMSTVPLNSHQWMVCLVVASISLPVGAFGRLMMPISAASGSMSGRTATGLVGFVIRSVMRLAAVGSTSAAGAKREDKR